MIAGKKVRIFNILSYSSSNVDMVIFRYSSWIDFPTDYQKYNVGENVLRTFYSTIRSVFDDEIWDICKNHHLDRHSFMKSTQWGEFNDENNS